MAIEVINEPQTGGSCGPLCGPCDGCGMPTRNWVPSVVVRTRQAGRASGRLEEDVLRVCVMCAEALADGIRRCQTERAMLAEQASRQATKEAEDAVLTLYRVLGMHKADEMREALEKPATRRAILSIVREMP